MIAFGPAGVDLFFVISGFIMVHVTRDRVVSPGTFFLERLRRVAPLYWLMTISVFLIALAAPAMVQATQADARELVLSLLFIPFEKSHGNFQPVLFVGWTLNLEMFFYGVFALSLFVRRRPCIVSIIALALLVLIGVLSSIPIVRFYAHPIILEFAAGILIALAYPRMTPAGGASLLTAGVAALLAAPAILPDTSRAIVHGIPATLIVIGALKLEIAGKTLRSLRGLGDASYSMYLTHAFVTQAAYKVAVAVGLGTLSVLVLYPATLAASCAVAVLVHQMVERRIADAMRAGRPALRRAPSDLKAS